MAIEKAATLRLMAEPSVIASGVVDAAREGLRLGGVEGVVPFAEEDDCVDDDAPEMEAEEDARGMDDWEAVMMAEDEPETEPEMLEDFVAAADENDEDPLTILIAPE